MRVSTLFHTVRHLRARQIYGRVRFKPRVGVVDCGLRAAEYVWVQSIARKSARRGEDSFRFLNEERTVRGWNDAGVPKLWLYNLHYFECPEAELIERWIRENPVGQGNGWEPYPLSLRIANWIKWKWNGGALSREALKSLAVQAEYLAGSVEYHLLANHLFVNGKALLLAGLFFASPKADGWVRRGLEILREQVLEQVLADGGHFERSPMYHCLILEDLLDVIQAGERFPGGVGKSRVEEWREAAGRMLGWLEQMCHPDGQISFFNDAALGIAAEPEELREYAARVGVTAKRVALGESGYIRLENADTVVLFDAAPIGPDYQPGHAHADTLSIEVSRGGRRVLVNSGTSTYENCAERLRQRGTAAHNTVCLDGEDQSEVWSAFRVARRARPVDVRTDGCRWAEASHDGYRRLKQPVMHRRRVELRGSDVVVTDLLDGTGTHEIAVAFHCHPEAEAALRLDEKLTVIVEASTYHPGFNLAVSNKKIVGRWRGELPVTFESVLG